MVSKLILPPPGVYIIEAKADQDNELISDGFVITIVPVLPITSVVILSNIILLISLTAVTL